MCSKSEAKAKQNRSSHSDTTAVSSTCVYYSKQCILFLFSAFYSIITPRACARGKAIGLYVVVVVVCMKTASLGDL